MPAWVIGITAAAAVLTSLGVIWRTFLHPLIRAVNLALDVLPVILDMAQQFKTDGGSSLRDVVNGLTDALERVEGVQAEVALELDAARSRADTVGPTHIPGAAADAAARHDPNDSGR